MTKTKKSAVTKPAKRTRKPGVALGWLASGVWPTRENPPPPLADLPTDTRMLIRAANIVTDRQAIYGDPYEDMSRTAALWSAILGVPVKAEQVALCMEGVKISRACNGYHSDNAIDGCGYWQVYESCATHDKTKEV